MNIKNKHNKLNFIDLFAGAGGLSEGFIRNGFTPIAHVEMNADACKTLRTRSVYHYLKENDKIQTYYNYLQNDNKEPNQLWKLVPKEITESVIHKEISQESLSYIFTKIDSLLENKTVDIIIGGPPCQAYSVVGRARDPKGMSDDPRNHLYKFYIKFLEKYNPKIFVFENVPGIFSAKNGEYLANIFSEMDKAGYHIETPPNKTLNAKDFNVLQDRKRVIMIGWKKELKLKYPDFAEKLSDFQVLKDLFCDLKPIQNGGGTLGHMEYNSEPSAYLQKYKIVDDMPFVTQHYSRPNNENDLEIYRLAVDQWNNNKRLKYNELPTNLIRHKNTKTFTNRFQVVNGRGISHTVVAHIAMDGHYYIHPDKVQNRSISVREAARIQSFPDNYFFEGSRTAAFRQIGNAVPVLMAEGVAKEIKKLLYNHNHE